MSPWFWVVLGIAAGAAAVWIALGSRLRGLEGSLREAEHRATSAEATCEALRLEAEKNGREIAALHEKLETEQKARSAAEAFEEAQRRNLEDQRLLLEEARSKLAETFRALSGEVLGAQSESFLRLAQEKFGTLRAEAQGDLTRRQDAIGELVRPLAEALRSYDEAVKQIEGNRQNTEGRFEKHLEQMGAGQEQLRQETTKLVNALRVPHVRGRWGEITLQRLAELAGMVEHVDHVQQGTITWEEGWVRPDMIIKLPNGREIIVDSKVSLDAYLDALDAPTLELRQQHLNRHATQVRNHMERLASKAYWERLPKAPEFVLMFLPGDPFLGAAAECDSTLIEDGMRRQVVIATPSTLIALLLAVHHGWRQERLEANARAISDLGRQLYDRLVTFIGHFQNLGGGLNRAVKSYNEAAGSLESRLLVPARKFRDLGAATGEEIGEIVPLEIVPRALNAPEADRAMQAATPTNLPLDFTPAPAKSSEANGDPGESR